MSDRWKDSLFVIPLADHPDEQAIEDGKACADAVAAELSLQLAFERLQKSLVRTQASFVRLRDALFELSETVKKL